MNMHFSGATVYSFHQILREVTNPPNIEHLSARGSPTLSACGLLMWFGLRNIMFEL